MTIKHTVGECPLGAKCATVIDDTTIEHCPWHTEMSGTDGEGKEHSGVWKCAISWFPILQVEMSGTNRTMTSALLSLRNEQVKRQDIALELVAAGVKNAKTVNAR